MLQVYLGLAFRINTCVTCKVFNTLCKYLFEFYKFAYPHTICSQGSNLGPLLFLIYFNDLPPNINGSVDSYADDTTITVSGHSVTEVEESLEKDCGLVSEWMRSNRLKINPDKTHVMVVGTKPKL